MADTAPAADTTTYSGNASTDTSTTTSNDTRYANRISTASTSARATEAPIPDAAAVCSSGASGDGLPIPGAGGLHRLLREEGQPALAAALDDFPGFAALVDVQGEALAALQERLGVQPAATRHTDTNGLLKLQSLQPGLAVNLFRSYRNRAPAAAGVAAPEAATAAVATSPPPLRTMTQIFGRYRTPDGAVRVYSKTTVSPPDAWPTPPLDIEIGGTEASLVFYVGLAPKANLAADLPYLERYYNRPPPPRPPPPSSPLPSTPAAESATSAAGPQVGTGGNGAAAAATGVVTDLPSFKQLEAEARRQPGFSPFVSPSLWVRAAAMGAMCFSVEWDGGRDPRVMSLIRRYVMTVTRIWLAHLAADAADTEWNPAALQPHSASGPGESQAARSVAAPAVASGSGGTAGSGCAADAAAAADASASAPTRGSAGGADPWVAEQWRRAGAVLRNHVRHDPLTPLLYPVFGEEQVTKWIETVSGEEAQG